MLRFLVVCAVMSAFLLSACSDDSISVDGDDGAKEKGLSELVEEAQSKPQLTVYKTPSCGCCGAWVEHIQAASFGADVVSQDSVAHIKNTMGIPENARSCHTAVTDDGYVFEGHVPAKFIERFLAESPENAKGLIVPAMPVGSPGMEYENEFNPYLIYQLNADGSMQVYAEISSYQMQF